MQKYWHQLNIGIISKNIGIISNEKLKALVLTSPRKPYRSSSNFG